MPGADGAKSHVPTHFPTNKPSSTSCSPTAHNPPTYMPSPPSPKPTTETSSVHFITTLPFFSLAFIVLLCAFMRLKAAWCDDNNVKSAPGETDYLLESGDVGGGGKAPSTAGSVAHEDFIPAEVVHSPTNSVVRDDDFGFGDVYQDDPMEFEDVNKLKEEISKLKLQNAELAKTSQKLASQLGETKTKVFATSIVALRDEVSILKEQYAELAKKNEELAIELEETKSELSSVTRSP